MRRKIIFAITIVGCQIFSAPDIFAQCGVDGTQPCAGLPGTIVAKPKKSRVSAKKKKASEIKPAKPAVPKRSALFNRLLGEWISENASEPFSVTYQENGAGFISVKSNVCVRFSFTLSKNILRLSGRDTGKCEGSNNQKVIRLIVKFDDANRLGTTQFKANGMLSESTDWFVRVKK